MVRKNRINTNDYSYEPINSSFSYVFEFGEDKARVSYVYNGLPGKDSKIDYTATIEKEEMDRCNNQKTLKNELLVELGMNIGKDLTLKEVERAVSEIKGTTDETQ